jgi:U3 small nucleolar ribonucleoprotein protein IMP4
MLRKNIRLRKEYLFHKEKENKDKEQTNKKLKLKGAIDENLTRIPTELFREEQSLRKSLQLSDQNTLINRTHIDDEYMTDFYREPKVVIVTSRNPSTRLTQFHKEMNLFFPGSIRFNRGDYTLKDLMDMGERKEVTDLVLLHEHRGEPDGMIVTHLPLGPTVYFGISGAVLRHDLENRASTMSEAFPHLIFDNFTTALGERLQKIISS